jgi:RHS repeat-associated protein
VIRKVVSGQETQYLWDYEDKMVKIVYPNGSVNEFETNYEGKRRKKVDSSGVTYFYYDGDKLLAEVDGSDNLMAVYEWGVRGLLSQFRNGVRYYYHLDGLGSVVQVTNESQVVVASYKYDAWGNDLVDPQSLIPNPFKYVGGLGYYSDKESGFKLLGVRYYDSQIGRFWSIDPIREGGNWYGYVRGNPINRRDPSGKFCVVIGEPDHPNLVFGCDQDLYGEGGFYGLHPDLVFSGLGLDISGVGAFGLGGLGGGVTFMWTSCGFVIYLYLCRCVGVGISGSFSLVATVWPEGPENYEGWFVQYFVSVGRVNGASGADFSGTTVSGEIGYGMGWPVIGFIFCVCYYWRVAGGCP